MSPDSLSDVSMLSCFLQLFSDHEPMRSPSPQISQSDNTPELSLTGTSAPLLTQPSLTDYLSNYLLWPNKPKTIMHLILVHLHSPGTQPLPYCHHHTPHLLSKGGGGDLGKRHGNPVSEKLRAKQRPGCRQNRTLRWDLRNGTN